MAPKAPWLRMQATLSSDPKVIKAGFLGGIVFRAVLEMMKAQGWPGEVAAAQLDGAVLSRHLNCGRGDPSPLLLEKALSRAVDVGLLRLDRGVLIVPKWAEYQPDARPHSSDRSPPSPVASPGVPGSPGKSGDVTDSTRLDSTRPDSETAPPPAAADQASPKETGTSGNGRARRDHRHPVEALLAERGLSLSGRGGAGLRYWRTQLRNMTTAGASDTEIVDLIAGSSEVDPPWDVLAPLRAKYGKAAANGRRGAPTAAHVSKYAAFAEGTR